MDAAVGRADIDPSVVNERHGELLARPRLDLADGLAPDQRAVGFVERVDRAAVRAEDRLRPPWRATAVWIAPSAWNFHAMRWVGGPCQIQRVEVALHRALQHAVLGHHRLGERVDVADVEIPEPASRCRRPRRSGG